MKPCPPIITYESRNALHESMRWLAKLYCLDIIPNKDGPPRSRHSALPISFFGRTEQQAKCDAEFWWLEEQDKLPTEEAKAVLTEKRKAAVAKAMATKAANRKAKVDAEAA